MENLLLQIVKDASGVKYAELRTTSQQVHDFLEAQQGSIRAQPHELRERCLAALRLALESRNNKLIGHALLGFQKLLRDDRFQSSLECEAEDQWLPSQVLLAFGAMRSHTDDVQVELLRVLLSMACCATCWSMNESVILHVLHVCLEAYADGGAALRVAAQATASQTLRAFSDHLRDQEHILQNNPYIKSIENSVKGETQSAYSNIVPVLQFLCKKLTKHPSNPKQRLTPFYLESLLSLFASLSVSVLKSTTLQEYLWKEFVPTLVLLLGSPTTEKSVLSVASKVTSATGTDSQSTAGRHLTSCPVLTSGEAKTVYNIGVELVRIAGPYEALRPMLESMLHRMLLVTSPPHRLEALRAIREIMKRPEQLITFAGPPLIADHKASCCTDLGLLTLAMDAFVECSQCSDVAVCYMSVQCVAALLDSLERICAGNGVTAERAATINALYAHLHNCDYKGPMTYQTWEKLQRLDRLHKSSVTSLSEPEDSPDESADGTTAAPHHHRPTTTTEEEEEDEDDGQQQESPADTQPDERSSGQSEEKNQSVEEKESSLPLPLEDAKDGGQVAVDVDLPSGYETDSSGSTEGPEEGFDEDQALDAWDASTNEWCERAETEAAAAAATETALRRQRMPKTLLGEETVGGGREAVQERVLRLYETRDLYAQQERENARGFVGVLGAMLPGLLAVKSSIEADEALQAFASKYCDEVMCGQQSRSSGSSQSEKQQQHHVIINADGIYLATYSALLLNLKLIHGGFYDATYKDPPLTEEEFVENVHGSGVLVYLSGAWLAELYQQMLQRDYLSGSGFRVGAHDNCALINLLADLEGLGRGAGGACHLLSDYSRLEKATSTGDDDPNVEAGRKFARRVLTGCWDGVLEVLSVLLNGQNAVGITATLGLMLGTEGARDEHRRARDAVADSLDGLQKAARLSNVLNLHSRCGAVFSVLATVSCPSVAPGEELARSAGGASVSRRKRLKSAVLLGRTRPTRLHPSHILSMDVILSRGLELGSHSPDCWKHIFRCCVYLAELEHSYFTVGQAGAVAAATSTSHAHSHKERESKGREVDNHHLHFNGVEATFSPLSAQVATPCLGVAEILQQNASATPTSGVLSHEQSVSVLCALSQQADRLFDDASYKLNLRSLLGFASALCAASQQTLFAAPAQGVGVGPGGAAQQRAGSTGLLHRVGDVMLKCVRSGRPLVHVMQTWSVVGLHLMEAACHPDQRVAKTAVSSIHDIVSALLASQSELPYFHFNEALFKPFENLLCLELCDVDIQDQIIGSICEFVEGCTTEICSGWRPLFGALRAVRATAAPSPTPATVGASISEVDGGAAAGATSTSLATSGHLRAVLDVFEAFLNTENHLVFANAAVDCILCLLKHIKGESSSAVTDADEACGDGEVTSSNTTDLRLASLHYIHSCCTMLARMQQMSKCPIFHAANRINLCSPLQFVDAEVAGKRLVRFGPGSCQPEEAGDDDAENWCDDWCGVGQSCVAGQEAYVNEAEGALVVGSAYERLVTLEQLERPSGILHVWCLVLEGLAAAVATASRHYQSATMKTLFDLLHKVYELPGVEFGLYVVNHLLLPMMQGWLRRTSKSPREWDTVGSQFKQCCGQTTDLVVDYITKLAETDQLGSVLGVKLLLHQLFLLMTECIASSNESISRLGCSCIRHVIISAGPLFTSDLWEVTCEALERSFQLSLFCARQLMVAFQPGSDNFYGDTGQVKVAAKSDCTPHDNQRLKQLAQQVFLLDNQRTVANGLYPDEAMDDDRSYIFLLYPPDADAVTQPELRCIKVPFRSLVVGLLSHQILLQMVGSILLEGLPRVVPSLANVLLQSPAAPVAPLTAHAQQLNINGGQTEVAPTQSELPGMLKVLTQKQLFTLLGCLELSYRTTCDFDCRPGLKFLVQKVARAGAAANLYKQTGASWTVHTVVLLELCLHCQPTPAPSSGGQGALPTDHPISRLREALARVGARYARLLARKNDDCFDRMQDQPIFFLVAPTDDYMESRHRQSATERPPLLITTTSIGESALIGEPSEERPLRSILEGGVGVQQGEDADDDDRSPESAQEAQEADSEPEPETSEQRVAGQETGEVAEQRVEEEEEDGTQVYQVATQRDIDSVVHEYKRRKQQHAMPANTGSGAGGSGGGVGGKRDSRRRNPFDQPRLAEVGNSETKLPSVLKDHEAHVKVYTEMLLSIFDFVCQLSDAQLRALLPTLFAFVRTLVAHANDATLRQTLAELLDRVASLYHFAPANH